MKKAFTLIEVLATSVLSVIFFTFLFTLFFNTLSEIRFFEAKENLVQNSFRLIEILTKGIKHNNEYISGMVCFQALDTNTSFTAQDGTTTSIKTFDNYYSIDRDGHQAYLFKKLMADSNISIESVDVGSLYSIKFDVKSKNLEKNSIIGDPTYHPFFRLVYVR